MPVALLTDAPYKLTENVCGQKCERLTVHRHYWVDGVLCSSCLLFECVNAGGSATWQLLVAPYSSPTLPLVHVSTASTPIGAVVCICTCCMSRLVECWHVCCSVVSKAQFPLPELTGDRFPLVVSTGRVDGRAFPLSELTRIVETRARQHGPCWRVMETGHPSTRVVETGLYSQQLFRNYCCCCY